MMKRLFVGAVLLAAVSLIGAGCSGGDGGKATTTIEPPPPPPTFPAGTTMERLQKAGKIKVGVRYDLPGFGLENDQTKQLEGFDIEIAKLIAQGIFGGTVQDASQKIEWVQTVSRNREPFLQQGTVDIVLAAYIINDARKQFVDFAGPYYVGHGDLMVKSENALIRSVADLNGKTACIAKNSTYEQNVRQQAPQTNVLTLDTNAQCVDALRDGKADAVPTDEVILAGLVQRSNGAFKLVRTSFTNEPYGVGLKKGDESFRAFLNDRLQQIEDSGAWRKAFESTLARFGLPVPPPPVIDRPATTTTTSATPATSTGAMPVSPPG